MPTIGMKFIFWIALFIVFYAYLGYGLVLWLLVKGKRMKGAPLPLDLDHEPVLAFVVCAFNEEDWIAEKIKNSIALDYPRHKITFYFVTDGSNDGTADVVNNYPYPPDVQWEWLHHPERRGKIAAFHRAMHAVSAPIVVSTDANTLLNTAALRNLVKHFSNPAIGAVAGEKRVAISESDDASAAGEGIYWKYESKLKTWDAELWSVVGAAGELFAFRRENYEPVPTDTIIEDFYLTLSIAMRGQRVAYAADAWAAESSSASVGEELKRKIRIAAGGIQAIVRLHPLLNIFKYGTLSFQYISHRVLRWTLAPLALPIIFISNGVLAATSNFYKGIFMLQIVFYLAAFAGWILEKRKIKLKALFVPYYFCMMNYAVYSGFLRYLKGRQSVLWEKAERRK